MAAIGTRNNDSVATPADFYQALDEAYHFDHDPCPLNGTDGLDYNIPWGKSNYINPPYSNIKPFIVRAIHEMKTNGARSVMLVPSRPNARYVNELVYPNAHRIWFLSAQMKFAGYTTSLSHSLVLIVFEPDTENDRPFVDAADDWLFVLGR